MHFNWLLNKFRTIKVKAFMFYITCNFNNFLVYFFDKINQIFYKFLIVLLKYFPALAFLY